MELTNAMNIADCTVWKVIINDKANAFKINTTTH